jgi:hypothetical protein
MNSPENEHWLVRPSSIRLMWIVGIGALVALTLLDILEFAHPHFGIDGTFGFFSWYGFATCAAMVILAKGLSFFLKRPDREDDDD